jgi:pimeloyl-ACP methyl ester carboxylesterase
MSTAQPPVTAVPAKLDSDFIRLTTKPTAQLCYTYVPASGAVSSTPLLVVFVNGLGLPKSSWFPVIMRLLESNLEHRPAMLAYDRYGQATTTDTDPSDVGAADPMHGHDCMSVVKDLRQLLTQIAKDKIDIMDVDKVELIFVCNSIGGAITRLYTQEYPGTVAALLILDSVLANSDFVSMWPDPDAPGFNEKDLPEGVTPDILRETREKLGFRMFHPQNGSKEGLSRKNLKDLLPESNSPMLKGVKGRGPFVTVVGHDFMAFAEENEKNGHSKAVALHYTNPYWHRYNEGLAQITEKERSKGPIQAPGCGHFIQRDNPAFVAEELLELLNKVVS